MKKRNVFVSAAAVALAAVVFVGGTFSYLAAKSDQVSNAFSANTNYVSISEDEADYEIIPGTSQTKNPYVNVYTTVDSYVYLVVEDTTDGLVDYSINTDIWTLLASDEESGISIYYCEVKASDNEQSLNVLVNDEVSYAADLENADMLEETTDENGNTTYALKDGLELNFTAYVIQSDGFSSALDAVQYLTFDQEVNVVVKTALGYTAVYSADNIDGTQGSYILAADVTLNAALTFAADTDSVLDLNGYTLTTAMSASAYDIVSNGSLTIADSSEEGDGTIELGSYGLQSYGALTVEGGTISSTGTYGVYCYDAFTMNGGTIESKNNALTLENEDAESVINAGTISVTGTTAINVKYGSLVMNGGEISAESSTGKGVTLYNDSTFEMNGGTITCSGSKSYGVYAYNSSSFTLNDGSISAAYGMAADYCADAEMNGGTVTAATYGVYLGAATRGGTFTMNAGTITAGTYAFYTTSVKNYAATITMNGGTISADGTYTVYMKGYSSSYADLVNFTWNGGTINPDGADSVYVANGTFTDNVTSE